MKPVRIVVHCAATPNGKPFHVEDIRRWHKKRGFSDVGYHGVIAIDGGFSQGRPDDRIGAHVEGHNTGSLGVCMMGTDRFAPKQFDALKWYIDSKMRAYKIALTEVFGHYEFNKGKACPGMDMDKVRLWLSDGDIEHIRPFLLVPNIGPL